jgi:hypothetical protein
MHLYRSTGEDVYEETKRRIFGHAEEPRALPKRAQKSTRANPRPSRLAVRVMRR